MIRDQLTVCVRQRTNTLIINRVHCRDILRNMVNSGVDKASDFLWNIQMRHNYTERIPITDESQANYKHAQYRNVRDAQNNPNLLRKSSSKHIIGEDPKERLSKHQLAQKLQKEQMALKALSQEFYPSRLSI